jgi:hypothetical protein
MSVELNEILTKAYHQYKDESNPPVPLATIKEFLELEGINLDDINQK